MIVKSGGSDVSLKSFDDIWPYPVMPPEMQALGMNLRGGSPFFPFQSMEEAMGLPALLGILLRLSTIVGTLPQKVYDGDDQLDRKVALDTWQYELLHKKPGYEHTPFTLKADMTMSLAGSGYCCVRKYKVPDKTVEGGMRIADLVPINSQLITPKRENGRLVFEDRSEGTPITRTRDDIIYFRAPATGGGVTGLAPITLMRMGIATGLKRQIFEGAYYDKSAEPRVIVSFPTEVQPDQAKEWQEIWNDQHQGLVNAHETGVIGGGATVTTLPISLADAQFVESTRATSDALGFVYGFPKVMMNTVDRPVISDNDWRYLVTMGLLWITTAFDQGFTADTDLFPRGSTMAVETSSDAILKPDIQTRYAAYILARQAGWLTANEIRALENYPPVDGGDVLQLTPVGGAISNTGPTDDDVDADEKAQTLAMLEQLFKNGTAEQREILGKALYRARRGQPGI